jgi:3-oxoacyl-[acyl-carrier protein] reductase
MAIPKYGKPEDIAELATYLASETSRFMTGASLTIDGGFSI